MTRLGLEALARFAEIDYWGTFANASLNTDSKSFQRACAKVGLSGKRAYDLRGTRSAPRCIAARTIPWLCSN